jgi:surfeit locus 1 family protein
MHLRDLKLRFRWTPTLLFALPIPLLIALGFWQLDRADQKRAAARIMVQRSAMPAVELSGMVRNLDELRYRKLRARGRFELTDQVLIENRHQGARNGFHVITPLRLEGSDIRVLVNRGWIPAEPDGSPPPAPAPEGLVNVHGDAYVPSAPVLALGGGPHGAASWGKRWPYLTISLFADQAHYPVEPVVILQAASDPGGFLRNWPRELPGPAMHIGYAVQWFAFAAIALVLYLRLSLAGSGQKEHAA